MDKVDTISKYVGKKIKQLRLKKKFTLLQVAEKLNLSHQQIQKYEQGITKIPIFIVYKLANIFNTDIQYFLEGFEELDDNEEMQVKDEKLIHHKKNKDVVIVMVEDDHIDEYIFRDALENSGYKYNLMTIHDGAKAIEFIKAKDYSEFPRPDFFILDLNVAKRNGLEILKEIKRDRDLLDIPVMIMTNSINTEDMKNAYKLNASGFICKSSDHSEFCSSIKTLLDYWMKVVVLPSTSCS